MSATTETASPPPTIPLELYTIQQAADALNIARSTLYLLIEAGEIPTVRFGRAVRVRPADLSAYVKQHANRDGAKTPRQRAKPAASRNGKGGARKRGT